MKNGQFLELSRNVSSQKVSYEQPRRVLLTSIQFDGSQMNGEIGAGYDKVLNVNPLAF